jgi:hypothetical protein
MISQSEFDLVLSQCRLPDRSAFSLLDWLTGSRSSVFLATEVESGCLWLPMLEHGKNCIGAPLLRSHDLSPVLENLLAVPGTAQALLSSRSLTGTQQQNTLPLGWSAATVDHILSFEH